MSSTTSFKRVVIEIPLHPNPADRSPAGIKITVDGDDRTTPEQMPLPLAPTHEAQSRGTSADVFVSEWLAGKLPISAQPALSTALFDMYEQSCHSKKNSPVDQKEFVRVLKRHDIKIGIGRFMQGKRLRQARILFPPGAVRPPGQSRTAWLTRHIDAFNSVWPTNTEGSGSKT